MTQAYSLIIISQAYYKLIHDKSSLNPNKFINLLQLIQRLISMLLVLSPHFLGDGVS